MDPSPESAANAVYASRLNIAGFNVRPQMPGPQPLGFGTRVSPYLPILISRTPGLPKHRPLALRNSNLRYAEDTAGISETEADEIHFGFAKSQYMP